MQTEGWNRVDLEAERFDVCVAASLPVPFWSMLPSLPPHTWPFPFFTCLSGGGHGLRAEDVCRAGVCEGAGREEQLLQANMQSQQLRPRCSC